MQNSDLANGIFQIVSPLVGETMARASIKAHCKKNGIDITAINPQDLLALAEGISLGLACFIGRERAKSISQVILDLAK